MAKKLYGLTDEHRAQLAPWRDRWIANALRTEPMTDEDREAMRAAMRGMYRAASLEPPPREVFCASPIGGAIAAAIGSGVWWLRDNPARALALFGRVPSEVELMAAIPGACARAVQSGFRGVRLEPAPVAPARPRVATRAATRAATRVATRVATDAATDAATHAATRAATRVATRVATDAATDAATGAATGAATRVATDAATRDATHVATRDATRDATDDATRVATRVATDAATRAATRVATRAATDAATGAATRVATHAATRAATRAATHVATRDATDDATRVATDAATHAATRAATRVATRAATDAATGAATRVATHDDSGVFVARIATFLVRCTPGWWKVHNGGNQWSGWVAYLSFFRHIAKLGLPEYEKFQHYEAAAIHAGPRFTHAKFWIVSDFPTVVAKDENNRPHRTDGPHLAWRDGWALFALRGIRVPAELIEHPERLTVARIEAETNGEVRRVLVEQYGLRKYIVDSGAEVIDEDVEPTDRPRQLLRKRGSRDTPDMLMVQCLNATPEPDGTRKTYLIPVHPELRPLRMLGDGTVEAFGEPQPLTAHNAIASTFGKRGEDYAPVVET